MARGDRPHNLHLCESFENLSYFRSNEQIFQGFCFLKRYDRLTEEEMHTQGTSLLQRGSIPGGSLVWLSRPWFTALQQGLEDTHLLHLQFGVQSQLVIVPYSLAQFGQMISSFSNALVDFPVEQNVTNDGSAQISEVVSDFKHFHANAEWW